MQFNPTSKENSIIAHIDFLLFGNGEVFNTEYSLTDRTRNVNVAWDQVIAELYKADPNYSWDDTTNEDLPIATTDLVANLDHYTLLDTALVIHRVRAKNEQGELTTLEPVLRRELSDSELKSTGTPDRYYKLGGAIFPIPIPNYGADEGLELEFQRGANHFLKSSTNTSPGFAPQFHEYLPVEASLKYAIANTMPQKIQVLMADKERIRRAIQEHYERRSPDERPKLRLRARSRRSYGL